MKGLGQTNFIDNLLFSLVRLIGDFSWKLKFKHICGFRKITSICKACSETLLLSKYNNERIQTMLEELMEKINSIEKSMNLLLELQLQQTNLLRTYSDVAKFLGKTPKTIYNYIKFGKMQLNMHFVKDVDGKVVFIPEAIIEFKNGIAEMVCVNRTDTVVSKVMHPAASRLLKGVA